MLTVEEAQRRILEHFQPIGRESISLAEGAGRVLASDVSAPHDLPLFHNSSMDGFAIRSADSAENGSRVRLRVVADIPAGAASTVTLAAGEAARIMTGAPLPAGADSVIPVEDTDFDSREAGVPAPASVSFERNVTSGENVRARGMDLHSGDVVLRSGHALKPQDLGLLAMLGYARPQVFMMPRVALISSGSELVPVDVPLAPGKVHDSNSYALAALIAQTGANPMRFGVAQDSREAVAALFEKAAEEKVDLILSSAGVSVGAFDYVKEVVEAEGELDFWRVNMRPGKPLAFGSYRGVPFFGLPGNPVSAFVGFELFVRPALGALSGRSDGERPRVRVRCAQQIDSDGRESYLRARIHEEGGIPTAELTGHQGSGNMLSLVQADALLIIPAGVKCVPAGQDVDALLL